MQAVHITAHGDPSVLEIVDVPRPVPRAGEVLVKMIAVSLNHLDLWVRRGMPGVSIPLPRIPAASAEQVLADVAVAGQVGAGEARFAGCRHADEDRQLHHAARNPGEPAAP